jgi:hypothetical protein
MSDEGKRQCLRLIDGLESECCRCHQGLCLRQQVLNLALGAEQDLLCLDCLAAENEKTGQDLLLDLGSYVVSRECFAREWKKYQSKSDCPDPGGCLPETCFSFT